MDAPPLAAVLAGGAGSRRGGAKAAVELGGKPLVSYPLAVATEAGLETVVVAKADSALPPLDAQIVVEPEQPRHPLAGVVAAMRHAGARRVLVLPCDTPFISSMLIRVLASATTPTAVRTNGRLNPLIALYPPRCLADLQAAVADGTSATQAFESMLPPTPPSSGPPQLPPPSWIEATAEETFNVNTPGDLAEAERRLRQLRS